MHQTNKLWIRGSSAYTESIKHNNYHRIVTRTCQITGKYLYFDTALRFIKGNFTVEMALARVYTHTQMSLAPTKAVEYVQRLLHLSEHSNISVI